MANAHALSTHGWALAGGDTHFLALHGWADSTYVTLTGLELVTTDATVRLLTDDATARLATRDTTVRLVTEDGAH